MIWLIGFICLVVGAALGALLFKQFMSDEARVRDLEQKLDTLQKEYDSYKDNVHGHFNDSAQLLNKLTDSYREVYMHMASGAQSLCPEYISNQLSISSENKDVLGQDLGNKNTSTTTANDAEVDALFPPRDYADKSDPDQKGTLAEDYGLDKVAKDGD